MSVEDFEAAVNKMWEEHSVPSDTLEVGPEGVAYCLAAVVAGNGSEVQQIVVGHVCNRLAAELTQLKAELAEAKKAQECCGKYCCAHCPSCFPGDIKHGASGGVE